MGIVNILNIYEIKKVALTNGFYTCNRIVVLGKENILRCKKLQSLDIGKDMLSWFRPHIFQGFNESRYRKIYRSNSRESFASEASP